MQKGVFHRLVLPFKQFREICMDYGAYWRAAVVMLLCGLSAVESWKALNTIKGSKRSVLISSGYSHCWMVFGAALLYSFLRWSKVYPLRDQSAESGTVVFYSTWTSRCTIWVRFFQVTSETRCTYSTRYHPESKGAIEWKQSLKVSPMCHEDKANWVLADTYRVNWLAKQC